jgi:tRNA(Glu) U13 pseudouridine synthase TruD
MTKLINGMLKGEFEMKKEKIRSTEEDVKKAVEVILSDKKSYSTSLNYAINYCKAARSMSGYELFTQTLYILNTITHWRHPEAKSVRDTLKNFFV